MADLSLWILPLIVTLYKSDGVRTLFKSFEGYIHMCKNERRKTTSRETLSLAIETEGYFDYRIKFYGIQITYIA